MFSRFAAILICAIGLSGCATQSQSCCGTSDSQAKTCCGEPVTARDKTPRTVVRLEDDLSPLRDAFNAKSERWRAVALVSPTCSECIYGAEAVRKEITDRYPIDLVQTISIWIPMLPTDNEQAARNSASIFPPEGIPQFYDSRQKVGWAYSRGTFADFINRARKSLPDGHYLTEHFDNPQMRERPQWDLYMLYAPGVRWDGSPPVPTHWIRHCGRIDGQKSTFWVDSPDVPPHEGNLFDAMREMAERAMGNSPIQASASSLQIEILGSDDCPNTPPLRANVQGAVTKLRLNAKVEYIAQDKLATDDLRRGWPTPTVLVNGKDLFCMSPPTKPDMTCRVYPGGLPTTETIAERIGKLGGAKVSRAGDRPQVSDIRRQIVFRIEGFT